MTLPPVRHGWLKHVVSGLETDPHVQYKVHLRAVQVWLASMCVVTSVFFGAPGLWAKASVLYLVLISLYANLATDYGSMSASMAAFGSGPLPEIPLDTAAAAHYAESTQIRALIEQVKTATDLLDEVHRHVSALAPGAGEFPPGKG